MAGKSSQVASRSSAVGKARVKSVLSPLLSAEHEKEIIGLIATTLDQAHTERHPLCLPALTVAAAGLLKLLQDHIPSSSTGESFVEDFRLAHPNFVNRALDFLVRQQSLETIQAMVETIQVCSCDKRHGFIHSLHFSAPPPERVEPWKGPFWDFAVILWTLITIITRTLALAKVNRMKERKKTRSKDAGYERFVHYIDTDSESLVRAVSVWYKQTFYTGIMTFLFQVRSIQPYSIVRALGTVPELAQHIQEAISAHVTTVLESCRMESAQFAPLASSLVFHQLITDKFSESAKKTFFGPHARAFYQDTLSMITCLEKSGIFPGFDMVQAEILPLLGRHASNLHKLLSKEMCDRTPLPKHVIEYAGSWMDSLNSPYLVIWKRLGYYSRERRCLHLKCGKLPPSTKSWKRCARCKIASYCSESCQKAAWTNFEAPHKDLCKDWSKLRTVWLLDDVALNEDLGCALLELTDGLKARAAQIGLGEIEILKTFHSITKLGLEVHKQLGPDKIEG